MGEQISRFVDGELEGAEADAAFRELKQSDGVATWLCYHVIGDSLRRSGAPIPGFSKRFAARLEAEPTILAPMPRQTHRLPTVWAAAATVAAVTLVGWAALKMQGPQSPTMAIWTPGARPVIAASVPQDYILAHRESSPTTEIQGVAPNLRAVAAGGTDGRP